MLLGSKALEIAYYSTIQVEPILVDEKQRADL